MKLRSFLFGVLLITPMLLLAQAPKKTAKQWEPEIRAFELSDKTNPPPKDAVLFIGSSSFRKWKTVAADFPEYKVINRGFGGSQIHEINAYFNRIVQPYSPKTIVFYAGDNDLGEGKSPEDVFHDFKAFADRTHWAFPKTKVLFISIKPSLARWKNKEQIMRANQMIEAFARDKDYVDYLDIFTPMLNKEGTPRPELFLKDGLHMTREGYELWISLLRPAIKQMQEGAPAQAAK